CRNITGGIGMWGTYVDEKSDVTFHVMYQALGEALDAPTFKFICQSLSSEAADLMKGYARPRPRGRAIAPPGFRRRASSFRLRAPRQEVRIDESAGARGYPRCHHLPRCPRAVGRLQAGG